MHSSRDVGTKKYRSRRPIFFAVAALAGLYVLCASLLGARTPRFRPHVPAVEELPVEQPSNQSPLPHPEAASVGREARLADAVTENQSNDDAETARIQEYLDSLYKKSDVVSSFRTKFDEDIDCIDFYAQPSVKARIAHGQHVRIPDFSALPRHQVTPNSDAPDPIDDVAFNGKPDQNGRPRK